MTPTDCNPGYPISALLVGGPMQGKRLNFPAGTKTYACVEGNSNAAFVPTLHGYNETEYKSWQRVGEITLFLHESTFDRNIHRAPEDVRQAELKLAEAQRQHAENALKLNEELGDASTEMLKLREEVALLDSRVKHAKAMLESTITTIAYASGFLNGAEIR